MTTIAAAIQSMKDHGYGDLSDAQLIACLSDANIEFCAMESWPFLEKQATVTVNGSSSPTDLLSMPADLQSVLTVTDTTNLLQLRACRVDDVLKDDAWRYGVAASFAQAYYRVGSAWHLDYPISTSIPYFITYVSVPTAFAATSDSWGATPAAAQPAVVAMALSKAALMTDDPQMSTYWEQLAIRRIERIREFLWVAQYDQPDRIVNIMDDDIQLF